MELRVPRTLKKSKADHNTLLILQAPCNDITNCSEMGKKAQQSFARRSSENTVKVALDAMVNFGIRNVIILARPRRNDLMEDLSTLPNNILEDICSKIPGITFSDNKGGVQTNCPYKRNFTRFQLMVPCPVSNTSFLRLIRTWAPICRFQVLSVS